MSSHPTRPETTTFQASPMHTDDQIMDAIIQRGYGGVDVLHRESAPVPVPARNQVVIEVAAAGVDRGVWHIMSGLPYIVRPMFGLRTPAQPIPGSDVAGRIVARGAEVTSFEVGDRVFGTAHGSYAQFALADVDRVVRTPDTMNDREAGVAAVSGLTAYDAVRTHGGVSSGDRVLVIGASGGVGSFATQIAVADGAIVTGVASAAKADFVRSLGATSVIDYRMGDAALGAEPFDVIIDINGRAPLGRLIRRLTPTGTLIIVGGEDGGALTGGIFRQFAARLRGMFSRRRLDFFISTETNPSLSAWRELLATGRVRPQIDSIWSLDQIGDAITHLTDGRVRGKAVIVPSA